MVMKDQIFTADSAKTNSSEQSRQLSPQAKEESVRMNIVVDTRSFRPRHSPSEWMILKQCPLRYQKKFYSLDGQDEKNVQPIESQSTSVENASLVAEKGLKVHSLLEHEQFDLLSQEFKDQDVGQAAVGQLLQVLTAVESKGWKIFREIAFEVPFMDSADADEALVGMMDRLEINRDEGVIRILDYKWTQAKKTSEEMASHYQLQLELYAWAAIQLCGADFHLQKLEAKIIHLSETGVSVIEVPILKDELNDRVSTLIQKARLVLDRERNSQLEIPLEGDHCRYCEFTSSCPAKR